jgi:DNA-binding MarR family transcriptional regulator
MDYSLGMRDDELTELVLLLPRVVRGVRRYKEPDAATSPRLGPRHGTVLYLLGSGPKTVSALARALELELPTVSGAVADLERSGLVERDQDPMDRRRTIVRLASDRDPAIEAWLSSATTPLVRTLDALSPGERAAFVKGLRLLDAELSRNADD